MKSTATAEQIGFDKGQRANTFSWKHFLSTKPLKIVFGTLTIVLAAEFSYRVRELLAALLIFSVFFLAAALILFTLAALDEAAYQALFYIYQQILHASRKSSNDLAWESHSTESSPKLDGSVARDTSKGSLWRYALNPLLVRSASLGNPVGHRKS